MTIADLSRFRDAHVVVIGDVMLDHYVEGSVTRVSDEAPVPILRVRQERHVAGGAANVAMNCVALGGTATLIAVTGDDRAAGWLGDCLATADGLTPRFVIDRARPTTIKTRYLGGQQQVVRVDREDAAAITPAIEAAILDELRQALTSAAVVVISDYAKGLLTDGLLPQIAALATQAGVPVLVDPKRTDLSAYHGATIITPNRKELVAATGIDCASDAGATRAAQRAMELTGAKILLTRSEMGMSFFAPDAEPVHSPAEAREVFDVSGAGDTVIATVALALAARLDVARAMRIANVAAGIAVGKHGTATVSFAELDHALAGNRAADEADSCIATDRAEAARRVAAWRAAGLTVGFANGCFDLIHPGHIRLITEAAAACDRLVVALNSDASVKRLKGTERPLQTEEARAQVMAAIKGVSLVTLFEEDTPLELIGALRPTIIVKGSDYREDQVVGGDLVKSWGGRVVLVDLAEGHSTTRIAQQARGDMVRA